MAEAFNSFDYSTMMSSSASETKLSTMIKNVVTTITGSSQIFNTSSQGGALANALTVSFSKMFYDLLNVKEDYTNYIDTFATVSSCGWSSGSLLGRSRDMPKQRLLLHYVTPIRLGSVTSVTPIAFSVEVRLAPSHIKYMY